MKLSFTERAALADFEWELTKTFKNRVKVDKEILRQLSERSNLHGLLRTVLYTAALVLCAWGAVAAGRVHWALAVPVLYLYWFFYGFWVALGHELQHKMVFAKSWDRLSEGIYFFVQAFMWNSPRYARISHQLHHRYTMVRGKDPETDWPEVMNLKFLRRYFGRLLSQIFIVGAVPALGRDVGLQIRRISGQKDWMMRDFCSDKDCVRIRIESAAILLLHLAVVLAAVIFRIWWPVLFVTVAWQIGSQIENLWHATEHIGRVYNVNDQRLATRSVKVGPLVHLLYGGLDDHVDHHLFPVVPSRNLPKLHKLLGKDLPEPRRMRDCWKEMFAIATEKSLSASHEHVPMALDQFRAETISVESAG
jgi:fatty acid desaturase